MHARIKYVLAVLLLTGTILTGWVFTAQADGTGNPRLRFMHALAGMPYVDVYVDGVKQITGLAYGGYTNFFTLTPGPHTIEFRKSGASEVVGTQGADYTTGQDYTIFIYGREGQGDGRRIKRFDNRMNAPAVDTAAFRFVHLANNASGGTPPVKVCITQSDDCPIGDTNYQEASGYAERAATIYDFQYRLQDNTVIEQDFGVRLHSGAIYSFVSIGIYNSTPPLQIITLIDNGQAPTDPPISGAFLTPTMLVFLLVLALLGAGIILFSWRLISRRRATLV